MIIGRLHSGSDDLAEAADRQPHEDHEDSTPRAHSGNDPGICVCVSLLSLAIIQALVASKHYIVETENKPKGGLGRFFFGDTFRSIRIFDFLNASSSTTLSNTTSIISSTSPFILLFISLKVQISLRRTDKMQKCSLILRSWLKTQTFPILTWTQRGRITVWEKRRWNVPTG